MTSAISQMLFPVQVHVVMCSLVAAGDCGYNLPGMLHCLSVMNGLRACNDQSSGKDTVVAQ